MAWIWVIFLSFLLPELGTLFRSARICIFKSARRGTLSDFFTVMCFEAMHVVGLAMLVFIVFPELDVIKGAMLTNCVAFLPGVFGLASRNSRDSNRCIKVRISTVYMHGDMYVHDRSA